MITLLTKNP